jgi:thiamine biosynthesis lipoprotein
MQRLDFRAMGCQMLALIDSDDASAIEALAQAPAWFAEWEASLSRFRDDSELSALNRAAGEPMRVSETLWRVIAAARRAAQASGGLVTPTLLDALQTAGYDRSFEALDSPAAGSESYEVQAQPRRALDGILRPSLRTTAFHSTRLGGRTTIPIGDWRAIELDARARTVRLARGMRLDLGGIAKGWAADQAARRLSTIAPVLIDAGGDIAISACAGGEPWSIGVADPFKPERDLELLLVRRGGVATSGRDYRRWQRDGKWHHHIIDPRTGAPAETDVLTATVIAPTAQQAEVAAKVALILGSAQGMRWIQARAELAGVLTLESGQVARSRRMNDFVWTTPSAPFQHSGLPSWS